MKRETQLPGCRVCAICSCHTGICAKVLVYIFNGIPSGFLYGSFVGLCGSEAEFRHANGWMATKVQYAICSLPLRIHLESM